MKQTASIVVVCFCFAVAAWGEGKITNISLSSNAVILQWNSFGTNYIVESRTSLLTGNWMYVGAVITTNWGAVNAGENQEFYRIRKVRIVSFPDANFDRAARNNMPIKYYPTNDIYDIDLETVTSLDVSWAGVSNMVGIGEFAGLTDLICGNNALTDLSLIGNTNLVYLDCSGNSLTNLNLSGCTNLTQLYCENNSLSSLDAAIFPALTRLYCGNNSLTNLDVSTCGFLTRLYCGVNFLGRVDLSACANLSRLYCQNNLLTNLDISANTNLAVVYAGSNLLSEIIVWDTNNLPATFEYDPGVILREP